MGVANTRLVGDDGGGEGERGRGEVVIRPGGRRGVRLRWVSISYNIYYKAVRVSDNSPGFHIL